ncbi:MAG TPA: tetratricopeptide repeat protein [Candidatus Limnocylindria bacterium]|nr:tetratricopeptide repeat protein [Candidatus Limnocylindria bacterium]
MSERTTPAQPGKEQVILSTFLMPSAADAAGSADAKLLEDPRNPALWLEKGHAYAKQTRFRDAIAAYSMGLTFDPFHALLLRFRGHRYLSLRFFQQGAADLEASSRFDPTNWDTWYHLGLAYYLLGDYERAEKAYETCLPRTPATGDPTLWPAIISWLWRTKTKLGKADEARALLKDVDPAFDAGENQFYQNCALVYAGLKEPETLRLPPEGQEFTPIALATQGYGLSTWYEGAGDAAKQRETNQWIVDNGFWAAFGYLAAEADLKAAEGRA